MTKGLITNEYYQLLVDDCKAIVTEAVFISRWTLVEGYHTLGDRIVNDTNYQKHAKGNEQLIERLARNLKSVSKRTLYDAIRFYKKYPVLAEVPEGKNISWNKLRTEYLPDKIDEDKPTRFDRVFKRMDTLINDIEKTVDEQVYVKPLYYYNKLKEVLELAEFDNEDTSGPRQDMEASMYKQADEDGDWIESGCM